MKTSDVFLKHVVPAFGTLIGIAMYASPLMAVMRVRKKQFLGELNPLPFPLAYANSVGWVAYSMVLRDAYVFAPNSMGVLLGLFNTLSTIAYARPQVQNWMNFIVVGEAALVMFVGAGTVITGVKHSILKTIWGSVAVAVLFPYYFAPLTTIKEVIQQRDSSTLYWPLCTTNLLCATLWFVYGLAIQDWFIGAPNGVGAAFSLVSLALCFVFPRKAEALMLAQNGLSAEAANGAAPDGSPVAIKDPTDNQAVTKASLNGNMANGADNDAVERAL